MYIHAHTDTHNGILCSHEKGNPVLITTWMGLETLYCQTEKDKYCIILHVKSKKSQTYKNRE